MRYVIALGVQTEDVHVPLSSEQPLSSLLDALPDAIWRFIPGGKQATPEDVCRNLVFIRDGRPLLPDSIVAPDDIVKIIPFVAGG